MGEKSDMWSSDKFGRQNNNGLATQPTHITPKEKRELKKTNRGDVITRTIKNK